MSLRGKRALFLSLAALSLVATLVAYFDPLSLVASPAAQRALTVLGVALTSLFGLVAWLSPTESQAVVDELREQRLQRERDAAQREQDRQAFLATFAGSCYSGHFAGNTVHVIWDGALGRIADQRPMRHLDRDAFRWLRRELWTQTNIQPELDTPGRADRPLIYETDAERTYKRELRGPVGPDGRYSLYAFPRAAGAPVPRFCTVCFSPDQSGANNCPTCIQEGRGANPL